MDHLIGSNIITSATGTIVQTLDYYPDGDDLRHFTHKHGNCQTFTGGLAREELAPALRQMAALTGNFWLSDTPPAEPRLRW
jgi:hypothetical protein